MRIIAERLDYLWFLGYGLDEEIPDHSVLSKARKRWGQEVFVSLFSRVVHQCVEAGLVEGSKIHVDSSLVDADASLRSVKALEPEVTAAIERTAREQVQKLDEQEQDQEPPSLGAPLPARAKLASSLRPIANSAVRAIQMRHWCAKGV
jgi:Transposase domain (DUF772)